MNIITLLIVGLVAGFLADRVVKNTYGLAMDILIGIVGSFLGTWLFDLLGLSFIGGLPGEIFVAFVGAVVLLLVLNALKRKS